MAYGNALTSTMAFNNRLQPCRINVNSTAATLSQCTDGTPSGNVQDFTNGFNSGSADNGSVMSMSASGTSSSQTFSKTYSYDQLNRISTMPGTGGGCTGLSWTYDAWGNRTDQNQTAGTGCNTSHLGFDANNRLNSPSGFTYDADGNLTYDGVHHYYYDAESRPIQVDGTLGTCSTAAACYVYDANGLRVQKTIGSAQTSYLYDLSGNVVAEDFGAGWAPGYVYAGGQLIAEYKNSTTYFVHGNHLGSSSILTSVAGSVVDCDAFYPFGEQDISICISSNSTSHKFTGLERDTETNLDHTWFRQYSSAQGRWMTPDPAGLAAVDPANPQSWNRYAYVLNDPLDFVDPLGLECGDAGWELVDVTGLIWNGEAWFPFSTTTWAQVKQKGCHDPQRTGGGSGGDGGFGQRTTTVNQCAAQNAASLASVFHLNQNNFWVSTFLGNDASALSNLAFGPGRLDAAAGFAVNNPTKYSLISLGANAAGKVPTGGKIHVASGLVLTPYGEAINMVPVNKTLGSVAGKTVGLAAEAITGVKAVFDVGAYIYAEVACAVK